MFNNPKWPYDPLDEVSTGENKAQNHTSLVPVSQNHDILLLQGPVGPFMADLRAELEARGHRVTRITFNRSDRLFSRSDRTEHYTGSLEEWEASLARRLDEGDFNTIILFGAQRPIHLVARKLAEARGIRTLCLEEGYIRPGFLTAEWGGNNSSSPVAGQVPDDLGAVAAHVKGMDFNGFGPMLMKSFAYYGVHSLFANQNERDLSHRDIRPMADSRKWVANGWRKVTRGRSDERLIEELAASGARYMVVALQVPNDLSLGEAALGWDAERLTREVIASFKRAAPDDLQLVFKGHPLARGHDRVPEFIRKTALDAGVADRVHVIEVGSLGELVHNSAGLITINSTSGLSAIAHGKPLLVVGKAVYASPKLAICANGNPDFDAFWTSDFVAPVGMRHAYLNWLAKQCLLPGDFYAPEGMRVAVTAICDKIEKDPA